MNGTNTLSRPGYVTPGSPQIPGGTRDIATHNQGLLQFSLVADATPILGLPDPETTIQNAINTAWPQVLAFSAAIIGVSIVVYLVRAFNAR